MSSELVSVIIPAYNAASYIRETVDSVLDQTHRTLEIIIVNDGSIDDTATIIDELAADSRIRVMHKSNSGVCDSRNQGAAQASGSFICFLDADDVWPKDYLSQCIEKLDEEPHAGAVYVKGKVIDGDSNETGEVIDANPIEHVNELLYWQLGFVVTPSSAVIRMAAAQKTGNWDTELSTAADQDYFIRLAASYKIVVANDTCFYYRVHDHNMHQNISVMESDHLKVFEKAISRGLLEDAAFRKKCMANLYWILSGSWRTAGKSTGRAIRFGIRAIGTDPRSLFRKS